MYDIYELYIEIIIDLPEANVIVMTMLNPLIAMMSSIEAADMKSVQQPRKT